MKLRERKKTYRSTNSFFANLNIHWNVFEQLWRWVANNSKHYIRSLMTKMSVCLSELKSPNAATVPYLAVPNSSVVTSLRAMTPQCSNKRNKKHFNKIFNVNIRILLLQVQLHNIHRPGIRQHRFTARESRTSLQTQQILIPKMSAICNLFFFYY